MAFLGAARGLSRQYPSLKKAELMESATLGRAGMTFLCPFLSQGILAPPPKARTPARRVQRPVLAVYTSHLRATLRP